MNNQPKRLPVSLAGWLFYYSRPWTLLAGIGFYLLGMSVLDYLGPSMDWNIFWLGLICVLLLLLSSAFLKTHFDQIDILVQSKSINEKEPETKGVTQFPRQFFLLLGLSTLTAGAVFTMLIIVQFGMTANTFIILGIALLLAMFFGLPPFRLVYSGLGEFSQAVLLAVLIPMLAYSFQTGEVNRLLFSFTLPMALLLLAFYLAISFEEYGKNRLLKRGSMLVRVGWQWGACIHNILLFSASLLIILAVFSGISWALTWPALLSLPVAIFQLIQMLRITGGARPNWVLLRLTAFMTVAITLYFVFITFITG